MTSIKKWPKSDRPRERLFKLGEHALTNTELLAILLRSGCRGSSALDLSRKILERFGGFGKMSHADIKRWEGLKGAGKAKIAQIRSALEIGRRFREEKARESRPVIHSSQEAAEILSPRMKHLRKEVFKVMFLDSQNRVLEIIEAEEGTVNRVSPVIREIFSRALEYLAVSLIGFHNHPSGDPKPSNDDKNFTGRLVLAGQALQINVLDHIIIGKDDYFSFSDESLI
ncbi:MAG: DNA repair protein RadC [Candidatus Omnitrophica bacterium]|nr:DNA repair protein RadC [Candidatus Omnitrophota bacterium]MDD5078368.1 DNA repair protein RadC [Candidatus Omnitrophota bacterium]